MTMLTTTLIILFLVSAALAGIFFYGWRCVYVEACELAELWQEEQSRRIDLEVLAGDQRDHICRLIARNAQQWAAEEVKRVH